MIDVLVALLQMLEYMLRVAAAQAAAESMFHLTDLDFKLSNVCLVEDAFVCVPNLMLSLLHIAPAA